MIWHPFASKPTRKVVLRVLLVQRQHEAVPRHLRAGTAGRRTQWAWWCWMNEWQRPFSCICMYAGRVAGTIHPGRASHLCNDRRCGDAEAFGVALDNGPRPLRIKALLWLFGRVRKGRVWQCGGLQAAKGPGSRGVGTN